MAAFKDHLDVCWEWGSKWYPRLPSLTNWHQNDTPCPQPPRTFCHHKEPFSGDTTHWMIIGGRDLGGGTIFISVFHVEIRTMSHLLKSPQRQEVL